MLTDATHRTIKRHGFIGQGSQRTLTQEMRLLSYASLAEVLRVADRTSDVYGAARAEWERRQPIRDRVYQAEIDRLTWEREHGSVEP